MIQKKELFPRVPLYYSVPMLVVCIVALLILVFVFRVEYPTLLLQPVPVNAINVSSCGNLTQNNAYYVLNQSIVFSVPECIIITGNNVVFDGLDRYLIDGSGLITTAFKVIGNNVSVTNVNITRANIALEVNSFDSQVKYNYIERSNYGINLLYSSRSNVTGNVINGSDAGILISYSNYSHVSQNIIMEIGVSGLSSSKGIDVIQGSYNNIISKNLINKTYYGLSLYMTSNNLFENNLISESLGNGIYLFYSSSNTFSGNIIEYPAKSAIYSLYAPNNSVIFENNTAKGVNQSYYDLEFVPNYAGDLFYSEIIDNKFNSYYFNGTLLTIKNKIYGTINFTKPAFNAFGANLSDHIKVGYNYAEVKSNLSSGLNKSAIVTLSGLPINLTNATVYRDGVVCNLNICRILSVASGSLVFNVTGWTNYTLGNFTLFSQPGAQSLSINEPDPNEQYTAAAFPVTFRVVLSAINGSVKFSLNNGLTNTTMINDSTRVEFEYVQTSLDAGNYTFIAFANFTNGTRIKDSVNFSVVNTSGSSVATGSGSNSGSGSGSGSGTGTGSSGTATTAGTTGTPQNNGTFGTTSGTGSTQTLTGNQSKSTAFRSMIFWLLILIISIMIIILSILIFKAIRRRRDALSSNMSLSSPVNSGGLISNLR